MTEVEGQIKAIFTSSFIKKDSEKWYKTYLCRLESILINHLFERTQKDWKKRKVKEIREGKRYRFGDNTVEFYPKWDCYATIIESESESFGLRNMKNMQIVAHFTIKNGKQTKKDNRFWWLRIQYKIQVENACQTTDQKEEKANVYLIRG